MTNQPDRRQDTVKADPATVERVREIRLGLFQASLGTMGDFNWMLSVLESLLGITKEADEHR